MGSIPPTPAKQKSRIYSVVFVFIYTIPLSRPDPLYILTKRWPRLFCYTITIIIILRISMAKASLSHQYGLTLGATLGLLHLVWSVLVALNLAQPLVNFIIKAHMIQVSHIVSPFSLENAAVLVVVTTIIGYIVGFIFGQMWTIVQKRT